MFMDQSLDNHQFTQPQESVNAHKRQLGVEKNHLFGRQAMV